MLAILLILLVASSLHTWWHLLHRWVLRQPSLEFDLQPRARWRTAPELICVYIALLWLVAHLIPQLTPTPPVSSADRNENPSTSVVNESELGLESNSSEASEGPERSDSASKSNPRTNVNSATGQIRLSRIVMSAAVNLVLMLILWSLLGSSRQGLTEFGWTFRDMSGQLLLGLQGFCAAVIPMAIALAVTIPFRRPENQHALLKLLIESPDFWTLFLIAVTAVVCAPLLEELLFRVILQGWLSTFFPPSLAISCVAVSFAMVHGWRDGLALLPLAFLLGYVFHRRHCYWAVVVIHALFNATMLCLALLNPSPQ